MFKQLIKKNKRLVLLLILLIFVLPSFASLLHSGYFSMQDDMQAFRILEMSKCLSDFQIPCRWIPDGGYGYGYPLFNFYAPSVYYIGSLINLVGFQVIDSVKILFVLGFIVSFISMYLLVNRLFGKFPALVSAMLFTYAPFRAQEVYVRGALSEFFAISLLPLPLLFSYDLIKKPNKRSFIFLSTSIFILLITHNLVPLIFLPIFIVWIIYWILSLRKYRSFKPLIFSLVTGVALASFFVLPMVFENRYAHVDTILSGYFDYRRHFVSLKQMFFSNVFGYGSSDLGESDDLAIYTGIIHWVTSFTALIVLFFWRKYEKNYLVLSSVLAVVTLFYLFLMHLKSSILWEIFPFLKWLQFPWRLLAGSILSTSIISGMLVFIAGKFKKILAVIIIALTFIIYGTFFHPKDWYLLNDNAKFSGLLWDKQLTISIFDYLPIFSKQPPDSKAPELPDIIMGEAKIINYEKGSDWQRGTVLASTDSVIRLPIFYFPGMKVYVDNQESEFRYDDCSGQRVCLGQPSVSLTEGMHKISVGLYNTPVRFVGNMMTFAGFMIIAYFVIHKSKLKFLEFND